DHFAVESQIRHHKVQASDALVLIGPRDGEELLRHDDICAAIQEHADELALILLPGVQYYTGQVLDIEAITKLGHEVGAKVGFDLAHSAGNVPLQLHDWNLDFAAWCTYKYLNSGPGSTAGCFVHERHHGNPTISRFEGWWGTNKERRFEMETVFEPLDTVEAWQVSNAPVLSMAAVRASLDVFTEAGGIGPLRAKSEQQIAYLDYLLDALLPGSIENITPDALGERGCQFALRVTVPGVDGKEIYDALEAAGVSWDWRYPDVIRIAPVPLYNSYTDIYRFVKILEGLLT
ncbi:MAG: kynureninase, partial [Acidimicrobiales bacterium]